MPPLHRGPAWVEGDEMIAAIYARKSGTGSGGSDQGQGHLRLPGSAHAMASPFRELAKLAAPTLMLRLLRREI
jgi:hypothetical protein